MKPILYIMSGLSFSGKTTLAKKLVEPLNAQLLSYDLDIWAVYKPTLPANVSKTEEWVMIEAKAREHIGQLLDEGKSVIFDDLSVERRDRDVLRQTASKHGAKSLVIFMDVTPALAIERQKKNEVTKERGQTSDNNMQLVISQLQRPQSDEEAAIVKHDYALDEVVAQIKRKVSLLPGE